MIYRKADTYPTLSHGDLIYPTIFVFHSTDGGSYDWLNELFQGKTTNNGGHITVHFAIYKDGTLVEYAPWKDGECVACWHAGLSQYEGRASCNFFSIGVEIQQSPGEPYTDKQIKALKFLVKMVKEEYPDIEWTTHKYISGALQGKWDPYPPWEDQVWPILQEVINGEEDMTDEQAKQLYELRYVTGTKQSYVNAITNALLAQNWKEVKRLNDEFYSKFPYPGSTTGLDPHWQMPQ
jgi:N-acetyl-anhydromuramyl-L-alanine amidase AmpD